MFPKQTMPLPQHHHFTAPSTEERSDLIRRAKSAWFDTEASGAPDESSGFVMLDGLGYVVLRQRGEAIGVYRVRSDNLMLRRMKRPPRRLMAI